MWKKFNIKHVDNMRNFDLKFTHNPDECIHPALCDLHKKLNQAKDEISSNQANINIWNKSHKLNNKNLNKPYHISRGFYKLEDIFNNFNNFDNILNKNSSNLRSFHLCEAPGAFIEYSMYNLGKDLNWNAMTIKDGNNNATPCMHHSFNKDRILNDFVNGDVTNVDNIIYTNKKYANIFNLITADGGINILHKYALQEHITHLLIFAQVVAAIFLQDTGGVFILKMFDIFTKFSIDILEIIQYYWSDISIYKPDTSRLGNSERYIVSSGFNGVSIEEKQNLLNIFSQIKTKLKSEDMYIYSLFCDNEISDNFIEYNKSFVSNQISYINTVLQM